MTKVKEVEEIEEVKEEAAPEEVEEVTEAASDDGLYTVKTPVEGFTGVGAGGVVFTNGVAQVPEGFILDWFRDHGYTVTKE